MRRDRFATDVAVIGGGPAGCAAALTLLRYSSLSVVVLERSGYASFRIGESLGPGVRPLLAYLGAEDCLARSVHLPAYGTAAAWGSSQLITRDFLFTAQGQGWHLDRLRFDRQMAGLVRSRGGRLLGHSWVEDETRTSAGGWLLKIHRNGKQESLGARFVIDAAGRDAVFARRQGGRLQAFDRLVGIAGICKSPGSSSQNASTVVEATPNGWWYSAPLPRRRTLAVFMSDADLVRCRQREQLAQWNRMLAASLHTRRLLSGRELISPLQIFAASSQLLSPSGGEGWLAAGEAAAAFDPLSSGGVGHALLSGIEAARATAAYIEGDDTLANLYAASISRHFQEWWQIRQGYYALEQRWPARRFWSRRHNDSESALPGSGKAAAAGRP